jgi:hypothetical protein
MASPSPRRLQQVSVLAALTAAMWGSELVERDLEWRLEALPERFTYAISGANGRFAGNGSYDQRLGLAAEARRAWARAGADEGLSLAFGLGVNRGGLTGGAHYQGELRAAVGWGWQAGTDWSLGAQLRTGAGLDRLDLGGSSGLGGFHALGAHAWAGPELRAALALGGRWRATASAGWRWERAELRDGSTRLALEARGAVVAVGFALALSQAPGGLE